MSYDLLAFRPGVAPADRVDFIAWFSQVVRLRDGHLRDDPSQTDAALRAWHADMEKAFPSQPPRDPHADVDEDAIIGADYRFGPDVVFARLDWRQSRRAQTLALKLARNHLVGLFDAGAERAPVWTVTSSGGFQLLHRDERLAPEERGRLRRRA
jgi:hypothetical protein